MMVDQLAELISGEEGFKTFVYDDANGQPIVPGYTVKGHPTIGYGRCLDRKGITEPEAAFLRQADILNAKTLASANFPWFNGLAEARQAVIISMIFNMGLEGVQKFTGMVQAITWGDFPTAASEMLDSLWAKQVPERSQQLAQMMISGNYQ